jgi:hypothetical protein
MKLSKEQRKQAKAEGGGLLNRYTVEKSYRGFESLSLRQYTPLLIITVALVLA